MLDDTSPAEKHNFETCYVFRQSDLLKLMRMIFDIDDIIVKKAFSKKLDLQNGEEDLQYQDEIE